MNDRDVLGSAREFDDLVCEHGTVGFAGDTDENYFDRGTPENGNVTVLHVTLYRGRDRTRPHDPMVAQGHHIIARLGRPADGIPQRNSQCIVLFPGGYEGGHGVGVVISTPGDPRNAMAESMSRQSDDGEHAWMTKTAEGFSVISRVGKDGLEWVTPWGTMTFGPKGFHLRHVSGARIDLGAISGLPPPLDTLGSYATISAAMTHVEGTAVAIGTEAGVGEPLAKATTLSLLLLSLSEILSTLALPDAFTVVTAPGPAVIDPALATLMIALSNAILGAISGPTPTLPSSTTVST